MPQAYISLEATSTGNFLKKNLLTEVVCQPKVWEITLGRKEFNSQWHLAFCHCIAACSSIWEVPETQVSTSLWKTVKWSESCLVVSDSLQPHGLESMEFSRPEYWKWVAFPFPRGSSQPKDWTQVSHIVGRLFTSWATRDACKPLYSGESKHNYFLIKLIVTSIPGTEEPGGLLSMGSHRVGHDWSNLAAAAV